MPSPSDADRPERLPGPVIEGLITTRTGSGAGHVAALGPIMLASGRMLLRPYPGSVTCENLLRTRQGVFHVTEDPLLLAQVVTGRLQEPDFLPTTAVQGDILAGCARFWEFRVDTVDSSPERLALECDVVAEGTLLPAQGWNRARNAVLEAAILATRVGRIPADQLHAEIGRLEPMVAKTAGDREWLAWDLIIRTIAEREESLA